MSESDTATERVRDDSAGRGVPDDPFGAFCRDNSVSLEARASGALDDLHFAAKDVMDIAGSTTGFGQPSWLNSHDPAEVSATVIDRLLDAGARLSGRTITDELSYSLSGENVHYGTPVNPVDPERIAGGSSCGSVAAVAGGLVDFALGTDCAGSVRLPASYCGVLGMRPTHGGVSTTGVIPFAPSFDTVGWFARDPDVLGKVGATILDGVDTPGSTSRLLLASDCFDLVEPAIRRALEPAVERVRRQFKSSSEVAVSQNELSTWMECFRTIQAAEIWQSLGGWIETAQPKLGPGIEERIAWARTVTPEQWAEARDKRQRIMDRLHGLLEPGDVLCLPSSPRIAPRKGTATNTIEVTYRYQAICLLSIAALGGLPQISLPLAGSDGLPLGLSLIARKGADLQLLELARDLL